ncbi:MAG: GGDEF domain-containing protein, partial [Burkholderiales bacterium]
DHDVILDVRSLVIFSTMVGLVLAVAILLIRRGLPEGVRGVSEWAAAMLASGAGALAVGSRSLMPDAVLLPLGNLLLVGGHVMQYIAITRFFGRPTPSAPAVAVLAAVYLSELFFTVFHDSFPARTAISGFASVVALVASGLTLFRASGDTFGPIRFTAVVMSAAAATVATRVLYTLTLGSEAGSMFAGDNAQFLFISLYIMLTITAAFGFMMMVAEKLRDELARLATLDPLTGIYNRRTMVDLAERELARATRAGTRVAALMLDLDHFKQVNDRYGHAAGDEVLRQFVATAQRCLRKQDLIGRYGGEEFFIVLPDTSREEALLVAQRLRTEVEHTRAAVRDISIAFTISVGLAHSGHSGFDLDALLRDADAALYCAKERGRNQVVAESSATVARLPASSP